MPCVPVVRMPKSWCQYCSLSSTQILNLWSMASSTSLWASAVRRSRGCCCALVLSGMRTTALWPAPAPATPAAAAAAAAAHKRRLLPEALLAPMWKTNTAHWRPPSIAAIPHLCPSLQSRTCLLGQEVVTVAGPSAQARSHSPCAPGWARGCLPGRPWCPTKRRDPGPQDSAQPCKRPLCQQC